MLALQFTLGPQKPTSLLPRFTTTLGGSHPACRHHVIQFAADASLSAGWKLPAVNPAPAREVIGPQPRPASNVGSEGS